MTDILLVGGGGREHALGWALNRSKNVGRLYFAPGNAGTARLPAARNMMVKAEDTEGLFRLALQLRPGLVVIGPEAPLAAGLADRLRQAGLACFGPGAEGARIEASKSWAKQFMQRHGVPTAAQATFEEWEPARAYLERQPGPFVVKADGLAAGKGVLVTGERSEALDFAREALSGSLFGSAGRRILIEEFMEGVEVSVLALCDTVSRTIIALEPASDYKRAYDGDQGPNTGGMGAYSPPGFMTPELREAIDRRILRPALAGLVHAGIDYRGTLYAGLMITDAGPKVVEFNCRFGDPETQSLLPRLQSDALEMLRLTAQGRLAELPPLQWQAGASVGVALAAKGYPGPYSTGRPVRGLENLEGLEDVYLFHAGTALDQQGRVVQTGGRVFNLVATGPHIAYARQRVYNILSENRFGFEGMRFRRDIAAREVQEIVDDS